MKISIPTGGDFFNYRKLAGGNIRAGFFMLLLTCFITTVQAQTGLVARGKVLDENRSPVSGATVQLKNTTTATTTDDAGNYSLSVPGAGSILVISYVGYTSKEVPAGVSAATIHLTPENQNLNEVVVVGYGTQRRVSVTGAVDKIGTEDIEGKPVVNVSQALQGVSPNLIIQQRSFEPG